ncbi:double-stranded RNA-binding protein 6 isoform X2 [Iris pallida]|uniref:Double-stranded RNA-binding protein 6 isoform X2 n=1 Tax=Iris pallida TaxID=29817 RepID=A0AAX6GRH3_IRIPA|nr:double-stranded RNA-binding protein 6 isoform X2 [Iris pallida]KAJ6830861.1 double-stranded RNA-binding protein 6 isoform X2 [Iris pallida]
MYKNQLQELAQRSCFNLPSYTCIREGPDHAPRFKAAVNFNGELFESPSFCTTLRQAEHSAAEVALSSLSCRGPSHSLAARILDETGVYKNLLQEISQRVGAPLPSYTTFRSGLGHLPVFTCTVELFGIIFTGEPAKNKKQAEKNAAMAAWSSLKQLARQAASSSTEPENNDEQEQITIARALLNYRLKEKIAMANNPNASPFPKKFPIPPEKRLSSSLQNPQQAGSKILPLIRQSTQRSRPSSPSSAEGTSQPAFMPQKFPAAGAAPYVPVCRSHYGAQYHGMAPPVTVRTAVPCFSAPPLPPPSRHHQLPPVMGPPPIRMASPVRIRQAVPAFAAPPRPAAAVALPVMPPVQVKESPSPPVVVSRPIRPPAQMEQKSECEPVSRPTGSTAAQKEETLKSEVKDPEESTAIEGLKKLQIV